jgi:hypothetical protein
MQEDVTSRKQEHATGWVLRGHIRDRYIDICNIDGYISTYLDI